jgi:hypothetical protein
VKSSKNPIGSLKEKRPLIERRDFHKFSLAKRNQIKEALRERLLGA